MWGCSSHLSFVDQSRQWPAERAVFIRKYCKGILASVAVALGLLGASQARADIVNGSFESGLTGWTSNTAAGGATGTATTVTIGNNHTYTDPTTSGGHFGFVHSANGGNYAQMGVYNTLSQSFTASAGDKLSFDVFFATNDYIPYNDDGYAKVIGPNGISTTLFAQSVMTVGNAGGTPWTHETFTVTTSGTYTLQFGARNILGNSVSSWVGADNVTLTAAATPEPASLIMLGMGAAGLMGYGWRRRRSQVAQATA